MIDYISTAISFLVGTATGAAGSYYSNKYTEKRQQNERKKYQVKTFNDLSKEHTKLFLEMKEDLTNPKEKYQMNFFIGSKTYGGSGKGYAYFIQDHNELQNVIELLQAKSCVIKTSSSSSGTREQYRFNEWFAERLKNWNP